MRLLLDSSSFIDKLQNGVDMAGNLTIVAATIGLALTFWALLRGA